MQASESVLKLPASQIDAAPEAQTFLNTTQRDGVHQLRFWRGEFWFWSQGAYRRCGEQEVRSQVLNFLDRRYSRLTRSVISNVLECLKAKSHLDEKCEPPTWLCTELWKADEVLATCNRLIHLPALLEEPAERTAYRMRATPRFFCTSALDFDFDPHAPEPQYWLAALRQWFRDDPDTIATLQEWAGYLLTPDTRQQKILLLVGPKRSGKGTIARVFQKLVGEENVAGPTLASLGTNFGLWPLLGKTLAIVSDARLSRRSDSGAVLERLLTISGEDALTVDRKLLTPVTCRLRTRLMIVSNELPRVDDTSGAFAGRMIVVPTARSFYGEEDETLTERLLKELPGILLWAIKGWKRLRERRRFVQPNSGKDLLNQLEELASPAKAFVQEHCIVGAGGRASVEDLFDAWKLWCNENGRRECGTKQTFGRDLHAAVPGLRSVRLRAGDQRPTGYEGIALA